MKISATIITLNEEEHIAGACESVSWADEIVVVDSGSTDSTREIAAKFGARVIFREWTGFAAQKQFAAEQAANNWIFSLDADERVSTELQSSIREVQSEQNLAGGYRIPRRSFYMGRWIKGGGWYPDYQLRLYDRDRGRWEGSFVHESVKMAPGTRVESLKGDILHFSVRDASHHHHMIGERYAPLAARKMFAAGRRTTPLSLITAPSSAFLRSFLLKAGFRDGLAGFSIAAFAAHHAFLKHLLLYEMQTKNSRDEGEGVKNNGEKRKG